MTTIEERLRLLEDKEAIREVLLAYGRTLDSRDTQGYADLFAADGEWSGGIGQAKTPAGIKKMLDDLFGSVPRASGSTRKAHHIMSNMDIEVTGDTATAHSRWMWVIGDMESGPNVLRCGFYEDVLVRENGSWKFQKRRAVTEMDKAGQFK